MKKICALFIKSGKFIRALKLAKQRNRPDVLKEIEADVALHFDLKRNELLKAKQEYVKRLTRLRIVQNKKKLIPSLVGDERKLDQEQLSASEASDSSQASNISALSSASRMTR